MHTIHLRDHWTVTPLPDGRVRHTRRFGSPRTIDAHETVWLVGDTNGDMDATVNGHTVAVRILNQRFETDMTKQILPRNQVEFVIPVNVVLGSIALEFRTSE